jgi:predicted nucleotidyltransferase component of viral defense system
MINTFFFQTLQEEGERLGIPAVKKRALIREYLQTRIISSLYGMDEAGKLSFIGGTSLRLLRGLDRFSEDLDFDNLGLPFSAVKSLFAKIASRLSREGFEVDYAMKKTDGSGIGEMRFLNLLYPWGISLHRGEKLSVKIDYMTPTAQPKTELVVLARFGFTQQVLTNTKEVLLAQKIRAIFQRKELQPRDFYDTAWFLSRNVRPDADILQEIGLQDEQAAFQKLDAVYHDKVKQNLSRFKQRLQPFLLEEKNISSLDTFGALVKKFEKE